MSVATEPATDWWQSFFDDEYRLIWSDIFTEAQTKGQAEVLWTLLNLHEGSSVLDAACGYGRLSRPLAERGACVIGVDQSAELLAYAEHNRGSTSRDRLQYVRHDLRYRLKGHTFDAAFNVFTSIGFGTEDDDFAIITTLYEAVRPGSPVLIEAIQRDAVAAFIATGGTMSHRRSDGIIVFHEASLDPAGGRITGTWYWSGPESHGEKTACMRVYTVGELIRLIESAGFRLEQTYLGISTESFQAKGPQMGGRIGLLARRP